MADLPSVPTHSHLGITPSANDSDSESMGRRSETPARAGSRSGSLAVMGTWYDRECRPVGRAVVSWSQRESYRQHGNVLLEVRHSGVNMVH